MAQRINFYKTQIDRTLLRSLTKRRDLPGLVQSLGILFFYGATTALCLYLFLQKMWIPMIFACYFHAMFSNFVGMEASIHELSHKTPFKTKWLNEIFFYLFTFLSWNNPIHFRESHKRHHHLTVYKGLDKEVVVTPAPYSTADYISWFFFDWKKFKMFFVGNAACVLGKDQPDTFSWDPLFEKDDPRRKQMFAWARYQLLGHIVLISIFAYFQLWVLIYTVSLSYCFATFLARSCEIVQHMAVKPDVPDWRITCHTMIFGPVMSFFYWRMNYHIEHHMFAAVPFYNLHKLHKAIAHDIPEPVRGYFKGVGKMLSLARKQRKDPSWCYIPEFPKTAVEARMHEEIVPRSAACGTTPRRASAEG